MKKLTAAGLLTLGLLATAAAPASAGTFEVGDRWTYQVINGVHCRVDQVTNDVPDDEWQTVHVTCTTRGKQYAGQSDALVAPDGTISYPYRSWWQD